MTGVLIQEEIRIQTIQTKGRPVKRQPPVSQEQPQKKSHLLHLNLGLLAFTGVKR